MPISVSFPAPPVACALEAARLTRKAALIAA
jgi:hypothetical protein